jgi:hypothetical protein
MTQTEFLEALGKLTVTEHLTDTLCYAAWVDKGEIEGGSDAHRSGSARRRITVGPQ